MVFSTISRCALAAPLAILSLSLFSGELHAQDPSTFVIAAAPGYGVEDCLAEGGECGRVVADAWCEAHGRGAALNFGRSEGDKGGGESAETRPYFITCGD